MTSRRYSSAETMLGAEARAAEYNAAKNASARQASREAEEQKPPPKPVPISLSAYTRNPQVNRNKGTKNWIPLVLPEADEDDENQLDESENSTVSSKEQSSTAEPKQGTPGGLNLDDANRIRVNMPTAVVPVAPRAMRMQGTPIFPAHHVSPMPHLQPVTHEAGGFVPTALYAAQPGGQTVGMFPHPQGGWMFDYGLRVIDHAGHMTDTPEGMRRYGAMMVPIDFTPTKQELKLDMLSRAYHNPLYGAPGNHQQFYDEGVVVNAPSLHQPYSDLVMVQNPAGDYSLRSIHPNAPSILRRPEPLPLHYHSAETPEPKTAIFNPQPSLIRHASLPGPVDDPVTPPRSVHQVRQMSAPKEKENEEPYDRSKKMQKFMAVQQEAFKTGKTVLHNPELRKNQEAKAEAMTGEVDVKRTPTKTNDAVTEVNELRDTPALRDVPAVPPGLEDVKRNLEYDQLLPEPAKRDQDQALHEMFRVGTDEWLDLKPVTRNDRKKMLSVVKHSALKCEKQDSMFHASVKDPKRLGEISDWMHTDTRTLHAARDKVDEIAADYSARLYGPGADEQEDIVEGRAEDIHAGLVRGAGNVMATLTEYIGERELKTEDSEQDYFNRTKPVPEYAIEQSGLGANLGNLSLFEVEKSGYYNPPHRIARDPRFRPQPGGGVSVKPEEEWAAKFKALAGKEW